MPITETAITKLLIDGKQPEEVLKMLTAEGRELRRELEKAKAANDLAWSDKIQNQIKENTKLTKAHTKSLFELDKVMGNLSGASMNQLKAAQRSITAELNKMTRGTAEYIAKSKQLKEVNTEIAKVRTELNGAAGAQQGFFNKASNGFNKYFGMITAGVAAFTGVIFGIRKAIDSFNEFEKSVSTLSSLTGLQGDSLKWLADQAKILSTSTTESGVRITSSAAAIVEAYKLMGSARPELLQNKEDLNEVTKQALILKEAAGIELNEAVQAVASSMNQFNLDASQSERVINTLAAGALVGSSEIADLTGSMKNVGAVANDSNMSLEQTVAALEVLGSKALKGEEAGTKLRGALLKMKDAGLGYASGQFSMADALEEANKKIAEQGNALDQDALKIKYFGAENVTAGTILLNNVGMYKSLTDAVTGTSEATKQAGINTDNNAAKLEQAKNKAMLTSIAFGEKLAPALTFSTNGFSYLMKVMLAIINIFETHGRLIITATSAIIAYTIAVKIQTLAQNLSNKESTISLALSKLRVFWDNALRSGTLLLAAAQALLTGNLTRANAAMVLLNQTTKMNPIGLLVAVIAAVVVGLAAYSRKIADVNAAQKLLIDLNVEAKQSIAGQKVEMELLLAVAQDEHRTKQDRIAAIKKLNEISPEYLGNLTLENINTKQATTSTNEYITALTKLALLEAAKQKMIELDKELIDKKAKSVSDLTSFLQKAGNFFLSFETEINNYDELQNKSAQENLSDFIKTTEQKKKLLLSILTSDVNTPLKPTKQNTPDPNSRISTKSKEDIKKEQQIIFDALEEEYNQYRLYTQKQFTDRKISQEQFDEDMQANEMAFLLAKKALLMEYGISSTDVSKQIADKEVDIVKDANKEKADADKKYFDDKLAILKKEEEEIWQKALDEEALLKERMEKGKALSEEYGSAIGSVLGEAISNQENAQQAFASGMLSIAFTALRGMVKIWVAQIFGTQVATKGFLGITPATILSGMLYGLVSAAEVVVKNAVSGGSKTKQRFSGKYDVIGADDGRSYSAGYGGQMQTGIYGTPTIVAERGDEVVIDGATTRNLRINFPDVIPTIMAARVPQRAEGNYQNVSGASAPAYDPDQKAINRMVLNTLSRLDSTLRKGIKAGINYSNLKDGLDKGQAAEDRGSKSS